MGKKRINSITQNRKIRAEIWEKSNGKCWYCGKAMNPFLDFSIDHFIPVINNGTDEIFNLVPCCRSCNASKNSRDIESFRAIKSKREERFTNEQIEYLKTIGVSIVKEKYLFHFEKEGLK